MKVSIPALSQLNTARFAGSSVLMRVLSSVITKAAGLIENDASPYMESPGSFVGESHIYFYDFGLTLDADRIMVPPWWKINVKYGWRTLEIPGIDDTHSASQKLLSLGFLSLLLFTKIPFRSKSIVKVPFPLACPFLLLMLSLLRLSTSEKCVCVAQPNLPRT